MSKPWIFLDLDGPVLDVSGRYHRVHQGTVEELGGRPLPQSEYWKAKRNRVPEPEILARTGLSPAAAAQAEAERLRRIETSQYLTLDLPWPWSAAVLGELARFAPIALVTLRSHPDRLAKQLDALDLIRHLECVVAGRGDGTTAAKAALIRQSGIFWNSGSVLIGDTEVDVESGRALGLRTVALGCGIRTPALLEICSPDALLEDLRQVPAWLDKVSSVRASKPSQPSPRLRQR
jgi:phosphoglycolate phosphatase